MTEQKKIDLIFVASIGRSGTTLLESMLGAHSDMVTTGEVQIWPHEIRQGGVLPCGSGHFVTDDPFWLEMKCRVDPFLQPEPRIDFFREKHNAGRTLRLSRLGDFGKNDLPPEVAPQMQQYGQNNYDLFSTFLDLVEEHIGRRPTWVVDASKDAYRLLWFIRSGLFNVKVLHMVKNPRGFIYSVTKQWQRSEDPFRTQKRLYYSARQSLAWVVQNYLFSKIAENHLGPEDYMLIQYEELASDPKDTFRRVCDRVGCAFEESAVTDFRNGSPFTIAGNPMRQESRPIQLDEKWKTQLPQTSRWIAELITTGNRSRYGYQ